MLYTQNKVYIITVCFNFTGATEAELQPASSDLLFRVLRDDTQVSLLNSIPDHYFGLRFMFLPVV